MPLHSSFPSPPTCKSSNRKGPSLPRLLAVVINIASASLSPTLVRAQAVSDTASFQDATQNGLSTGAASSGSTDTKVHFSGFAQGWFAYGIGSRIGSAGPGSPFYE